MPYPQQYKPEFPELLIDHMSKGFSINSFGADINVTKQTIYTWLNKYPEFKEAEHIGDQKRTKFYELALARQGLTGKGNTAALIFLSKNMTWLKDLQTVEHSGKVESVTGNEAVTKLANEFEERIKKTFKQKKV